jgi:MATE family multidrug resistance protein
MLPFSRFEAKTILRLSLPIVVTQLMSTMMYVIDTVMAGRVSAMDMAAIAVASAIWLPIILTLQGLLLALTPIIAQHHGALAQQHSALAQQHSALAQQNTALAQKNSALEPQPVGSGLANVSQASTPQHITNTTLQGGYIALSGATLIFMAMQFIQYPMSLLEMDPQLRDKAVAYLGYVAYGVFPAAGYMVLRNLFEGIGFTKVSMWIGVLGLLVNIPANYLFINGLVSYDGQYLTVQAWQQLVTSGTALTHGQQLIPAFGGPGCGIATALVFLAMCTAMLIYAARSQITAAYRSALPRYRPQWQPIWQIIALGTPIAFSLFFEVTLFSCIPLMIVHLGPIVVAGHQIANSFSALVFMLPMSMGMATTIRVGHLVGAQQLENLKVAISTALWMAMLMAFAIAGFTFIARFWVAGFYSQDSLVIQMAASILVLACFYQLSDAIQVVSSCALRGLKITKPIFYITFVAYWPIGFGLGTVLGRTDWLVPAMGAHGFWIGIIIGLSVAAVLLGWLLRQQLRRIDDAIVQHTAFTPA